jgi:S1-C subfamily serine protease
MFRKSAVAIAIVAAIGFCGASSAIAGGPFGTIPIEGWTGGGFTDDSGAFSHCAAVKAFPNGYALILIEKADRTWVLALSNDAWRLTKGTPYTVDISFDGQAQFRSFGKAASSKMIAGPLPDTAANRLGKSQLLAATWNNQTEQFKLGAVDKLPQAMANCVEKMAAGNAGAGDFTASAAKPATGRRAIKSEHTAAKAEEPPAETAEPKKPGHISGTGFVVSAKGHIVTNNHVVAHCVDDIHGNLTGQSLTSLRVVATDEINDLALLQPQAKKNMKFKEKEVVHIRSTPIHSGDAVLAIGFPLHGLLSSDFTVTTGIVNSLSGILNDSRFLQISAEVQPGNSGGPLLDTSGNLVGVVSEKLNALRFAKLTGDIPQNVNFAIKTGAVRDFLDNSAIPYETAESSEQLKNSDITEQARTYTMLIGCTAAPGDPSKGSAETARRGTDAAKR